MRRSIRETPGLTWVNTLMGNMKRSMDGTYHSVRPKYLARYLAEFQYRFNRRYDLAAMADRLLRAAAPKTGPAEARPRGAARFSLAGRPSAHPGGDPRTATLRPLRGIASTVSVPVLRRSDSSGLRRLP